MCHISKSSMQSAIEIHISQTGDDRATGGKTAPFRTLKRAIQEAAGHETAVIRLSEGTYPVLDPVVIDSHALSGVKQLDIIGSDQGKTVLNGCAELTLNWSVWKGSILVAQVASGLFIDALYVNGLKQIMARYPNYQEGTALGGYAADAISPERVARWANPAGGYIRALHFSEWGGNDYIIAGKNPDRTLAYQWVGDNNRGSGMHDVKRMVENIFEELDSPGEWFYNRETGQLFFWPPEAIDVYSAVFEVSINSLMFHICGESPESSVGNIRLSDLTIEKTSRTLFTGEYERPLRGDWGFVRTGVFLLENARDVAITGIHFNDIGGNVITLSGYNEGHVIDRCDFTHIGATGVLVAGKISAVRDPSTYDGDNHKTVISDFIPGPLTEEYPRDTIISNNWFYDIGCNELQAAAVNLSISNRITVKKNTIHHTTRAGINIHDGTFGGHLIEGNDMFDCVTQTADHGPFNAWGRDRFWSVPQHDAMGYLGREKRPFALLDAWETTVIRNNRINADHGFGFDLDDGASNYDIYNNLCIGVGIKTREGFDRKVHNNMLIGSGFEVHVSYAQNNDLFYNNVVVNRKILNTIAVNEGATTIFNNNTYWDPSNIDKGPQGLPEDDFASIVADPLFMGFEGNKFGVRPESPALKRGYVNFPMSDADFGRPDCPKPPKFHYYTTSASARKVYFFDVLLSEIDGDGMRSAAGLPDLNGVFIMDRDALGIFSSLGFPIGVGDVIRRIGDKKLQNIDDFLEAFNAMPLKVPIVIELYRSQKPMTIECFKGHPVEMNVSEA